jgi:hypothetical protein
LCFGQFAFSICSALMSYCFRHLGDYAHATLNEVEPLHEPGRRPAAGYAAAEIAGVRRATDLVNVAIGNERVVARQMGIDDFVFVHRRANTEPITGGDGIGDCRTNAQLAFAAVVERKTLADNSVLVVPVEDGW